MRKQIFSVTQISCVVTAQLISVFVYTSWIVKPLFLYQNVKLLAFFWVGNPEDRCTHDTAHISAINPFVINELAHRYLLDESTFIFRGIRSDF